MQAQWNTGQDIADSCNRASHVSERLFFYLDGPNAPTIAPTLRGGRYAFAAQTAEGRQNYAFKKNGLAENSGFRKITDDSVMEAPLFVARRSASDSTQGNATQRQLFQTTASSMPRRGRGAGASSG